VGGQRGRFDSREAGRDSLARAQALVRTEAADLGEIIFEETPLGIVTQEVVLFGAASDPALSAPRARVTVVRAEPLADLSMNTSTAGLPLCRSRRSSSITLGRLFAADKRSVFTWSNK